MASHLSRNVIDKEAMLRNIGLEEKLVAGLIELLHLHSKTVFRQTLPGQTKSIRLVIAISQAMRDLGYEFSYCLKLCNQTFSDIMFRENIEDINKRFKHPSSHTRSRLTDFDGRARYLHEATERDRREATGKSVRKSLTRLDKEDVSDNSSSDTSWRITMLARKKDKWVLQK